MKIFVINLEKDTERRLSIQEQMQKFSLAFEFYKGFYAKQMSPDEISLHYNKKKTYRNLCMQLVPAQIGCALSHLMLYKKIVDESIEITCIFEDDVILPKTIENDLNYIVSKMSIRVPQICLLSPVQTNGNVKFETNHFTIEGFEKGFFTSAYIINNLAAKSLFNNLYPICNVADCWSYIRNHGFVEILATNPGLVEQDQEEFGSSTTSDLNDNEVSKVAKTFKYKISRAFWLSIDFLKALYDRNLNNYGGVVKK